MGLTLFCLSSLHLHAKEKTKVKQPTNLSLLDGTKSKFYRAPGSEVTSLRLHKDQFDDFSLNYYLTYQETPESNALLSCPAIFRMKPICFKKNDEDKLILLDPGHADDSWARNGMSSDFPKGNAPPPGTKPRKMALVEGYLNKGLEIMLSAYLRICAPYNPDTGHGIKAEWIRSTRYPGEKLYGEYEWGKKASSVYGSTNRKIVEAAGEGLKKTIQAHIKGKTVYLNSIHFNSRDDWLSWKGFNLYFTKQENLGNTIDKLKKWKIEKRNDLGPLPSSKLSELTHLITLMEKLKIQLASVEDPIEEDRIRRQMIVDNKLLVTKEGPEVYYHSGNQDEELAKNIYSNIDQSLRLSQPPLRSYQGSFERNTPVNKASHLVTRTVTSANKYNYAILVEAGYMDGYYTGLRLIQESLQDDTAPIVQVFKAENQATESTQLRIPWGDMEQQGYYIPKYSLYVARALAQSFGELYQCE